MTDDIEAAVTQARTAAVDYRIASDAYRAVKARHQVERNAAGAHLDDAVDALKKAREALERLLGMEEGEP